MKDENSWIKDEDVDHGAGGGISEGGSGAKPLNKCAGDDWPSV